MNVPDIVGDPSPQRRGRTLAEIDADIEKDKKEFEATLQEAQEAYRQARKRAR